MGTGLAVQGLGPPPLWPSAGAEVRATAGTRVPGTLGRSTVPWAGGGEWSPLVTPSPSPFSPSPLPPAKCPLGSQAAGSGPGGKDTGPVGLGAAGQGSALGVSPLSARWAGNWEQEGCPLPSSVLLTGGGPSPSACTGESACAEVSEGPLGPRAEVLQPQDPSARGPCSGGARCSVQAQWREKAALRRAAALLRGQAGHPSSREHRY